MSPMVDVPHKLGLRPLGSRSLAKAAGLCRYNDATSGLHRLRNSGKRTTTPKAIPAITTLRWIMIIPSFATNPACSGLCSLFGKLPSRFHPG
jgi:hypothetical protein